MTTTITVADVLRELTNRYTALADGYRRAVSYADDETLARVYELACEDAPGWRINEALGISE